jgi:sugar phosphate permease
MDLQPEADVQSRRQRDVKKVSNLRYWVLGSLVLAGILNYRDRHSVSIAAPHMIAELGLTKTDIGLMGAVFSWTYAVCQLPAGYLIDKLARAGCISRRSASGRLPPH